VIENLGGEKIARPEQEKIKAAQGNKERGR